LYLRLPEPFNAEFLTSRISSAIAFCMRDVGACLDNTVVERFFGSLKHDWLLKVP
jgi:transposase InsO family protein